MMIKVQVEVKRTKYVVNLIEENVMLPAGGKL